MLDYKDIITRHYALKMSGKAIAEALGVSPSGVNDFLRAFKECRTLRYPLPPGITNYGIAAEVYGKNPAIVGRDLSYEMPDYHDGQIVWMQRCETLRVGEVGIFLYDGCGYLKEYREQEPEDSVRDSFTDSDGAVRKQPVLVSYNRRYAPILV